MNFTDIKGFRLPIRLWGQAFRGYEIEVKTPIYKIFKPGPERLTRKDQQEQEENKSKKNGTACRSKRSRKIKVQIELSGFRAWINPIRN